MYTVFNNNKNMTGLQKLFLLLLASAALIIFCAIYYSRLHNTENLETTLLIMTNSNYSRQKLILFGSTWYEEYLGGQYPYLEETKQVCPQCIFTQNSEFWNITDAVVFHGYSLAEKPDNYSRPPGQIWIWMYDETPRRDTNDILNKLKHYPYSFNWTMTYRHNSDVFWPYGRFVNRKIIPRPKFDAKWAYLPLDTSGDTQNYNDAFILPTIQDLKNRSMVAWISSNCYTESNRESIATQLSEFVTVDIYGDCGEKKCGNPRWRSSVVAGSGNPGIDCRLELSKKYKFYLSFENSLCEDYVTEKYFDTLFTQMIPIVYGKVNYSSFAPEKSYINVADFPNVQKLAHYLIYLDQNPIEFLKYFKWRKDFWVQNNGWVIGYCALCEKLWNPGETKSYADVKKWFKAGIEKNKSTCIHWNATTLKFDNFETYQELVRNTLIN